MGDHQKIHPVEADVEAPPTTPLVAPGSHRSEKGVPDPLPYHSSIGSIEPITPKEKKRKNCCCRCLCCTITTLILLIVAIAISGLVLYIVFQPKLPKYSIDTLRVADFKLNYDMTLYARFTVKITASNPNDKIGIYYEKGSHLSVWYTNTKLCGGSLPKFYQGHHNTTVLNVILTGRTTNATALMNALQESHQTGQVPLVLKVDVPVAVELGKLKLRAVRLVVTCQLVADSLSANNMIKITASNCKFRPEI
ncbi:Late embryogenesis abundant protein, LEA_2 subgroup [Dillenia turbinata]|uniref:Late embryogenesis abundant protein, LEA_2 subgroup n=1 Tax=Dillenia turbinata TaxID=194707 RepID=A0AAN8VDF0_9MAGN